MDKFDFLSPLDYRYFKEEFSEFLSENARIRYQALVEAALVKALARQRVCSTKIAAEVLRAAQKVTAAEVYKEEAVTRHDVRALANVLRSKVSDSAKPFVHLGATSYDIVDTANALRFRHAAKKLVLPSLIALEKTWISLALKNKGTLQIGRTHGQHAVPITFGFTMASYIERLGNRVKEIGRAEQNLCGKFSGAVGAYNASSLIVKDPLRLEADVMKFLGLKPCRHSTQVVSPEPMQDLINALLGAFTVLANFSDDMRHLSRTEIGEIAEEFGAKQVGSSTMPHKRNPVNFENVKSLWKVFVPRMATVYMDSISEHQRDLTNSASQRFLGEFFAALVYSADKLRDVSRKIVVDEKGMKRNIDQSATSVVAEPLYILLAKYGHKDAHEAVRTLAMKAQKSGASVFDLAMDDKKLKLYLLQFSKKEIELVKNPALYTGLSAKKAEQVSMHWRKEF